MSRDYRPRRCSKRWLDGDCPAEVLAIMDDGKSFDRYTVFYTETVRDDRDTWVSYRGMSKHPTSPQGFGISGQMKAHEVADYRYRCKHHYATWTSLPDEVKDVVRRDCEAIRQARKGEE